MQLDDNATLAPETEAAQKEDKRPALPGGGKASRPVAFFEIYWPYFEQPIDQA